MKKLLSLLLTAIMTLGIVTGCSQSGNKNKGEGPEIVIYTGGSSEFAWSEGSEEQKVVDYVCEKYKKDTGNSIRFKVHFLGQSMKTKLGTDISGKEPADVAVSHTRGGEGIDDFIMNNEYVYDISDLLDDYGENVKKYISGSPTDALTTADGDVIGIPSVINPYKFGILVRKDLMEKAGYTADEADTSKIYVNTIEKFEEMCAEMLKQNPNLKNAITGASWDLEKVLVLGPYTDSGYFTYTTRGEGDDLTVLPGFATEEYTQVLQKEYEWASADYMEQYFGITDKRTITSVQANATLIEQAESNFISGSTAVFVEDPTVTHLIKVARKCKAQNPEAEFALIGPLTADDKSTKKGFMRNTEATFAACFIKGSKNAKALMQFMNWVFESEENYNLCRLGIEGEHWVNNGDGTYSYPAGKEEYLTKPPYSGILTLVENQRISDLTYKEYTAEEKSWIERASNPDWYIKNDLIDYMLTMNAGTFSVYESYRSGVYSHVQTVWAGKRDPLAEIEGKGIEYTEYYRNNFLNGAKSCLSALTADYKIMKRGRS